MFRPFEDFLPAARCVSVIGSGGKTTLLRHLSEKTGGTVILTTSTHIYPFPGVPLAASGSLDEVRSTLAEHRVVCVGRREPSGKLSAPEIPFEDLLSVADRVLIEADGAAGRPLKAHRPWEPVIPACTDQTVCVVGASGLGKPASEVCHCPERFCALAGTTPEDRVEIEHVARVLKRENLADWCLINQIDTLPDLAVARRLCDMITVDAFAGSLGTVQSG